MAFEGYYEGVKLHRKGHGAETLSAFICDGMPYSSKCMEKLADDLELRGDVIKVATALGWAVTTGSSLSKRGNATRLIDATILITAIELEFERTEDPSQLRSMEEFVDVISPTGTNVNTKRGNVLREDWSDSTEAKHAIIRELIYLRDLLGIKHAPVELVLYAKRNAINLLKKKGVMGADDEARSTVLNKAFEVLDALNANGEQFVGGTASKAAASIWIAAQSLGIANRIHYTKLSAAANVRTSALQSTLRKFKETDMIDAK